jgi:hypothetical protein
MIVLAKAEAAIEATALRRRSQDSEAIAALAVLLLWLFRPAYPSLPAGFAWHRS